MSMISARRLPCDEAGSSDWSVATILVGRRECHAGGKIVDNLGQSICFQSNVLYCWGDWNQAVNRPSSNW